MKLRIAVLIISILFSAFSFAAEDADALLNKALDLLLKNSYVGDTSAAERYLQAILDQQPEHLEAQWQLIRIKLPSINVPLIERSPALAAVGPAFTRLAKQAKQNRNQAFLHYITAVYASYHGAHQRALSEIEKALALEPNSTRYVFVKGVLLVNYGAAIRQDGEIEKGITDIKKAKELAKKVPNRFALNADYDFEIAYAIAQLHKPRWEEVVEYYRLATEQSEKSVLYALAKNNTSRAYIKLRECNKAKEAAEEALKIIKFGAAESNKRYAEFCLEMQKMGLLANK